MLIRQGDLGIRAWLIMPSSRTVVTRVTPCKIGLRAQAGIPYQFSVTTVGTRVLFTFQRKGTRLSPQDRSLSKKELTHSSDTGN